MAELKSAPPTGEWRPPSKSQRRAWRRLRLASCRQVVVDFSWLGLLDYGGISPSQHVEQWIQEPVHDSSKRWTAPDTISCNAGPRACEKGTGSSVCEKLEARVEPDVINYSAGINDCEKGEVKLEPDIRHGKGYSVCEKREAKIEPDAISYIAGTRTCEKGEAKLEPDIISISTGISDCKKARAEPDVINFRTCEKGEAKAKLEPDIISISTGNCEREKVTTRAEHNAISCSTESGVSEREAKLEPTLSSPSYSSSHLVATAGSEHTDIISYRVGTRECEKGEAKLEPISISTGNSVCEKVVARAESNAISCSAEASVCEKGQAKLEPDDIISFSTGNSVCEKGHADVFNCLSHSGVSACEIPDLTFADFRTMAQAARAEARARAAEAVVLEAKPYASSYKAEISVCEKGQAKLEPECEKREAKLEPTIFLLLTGISACDKQAARAEPYASSYKAETSVCEKGQAKLEPECKKREPKLEPTICNPSYSPHLVVMAGSENTSKRAMFRISACEKGKAWQDERVRLLRDSEFARWSRIHEGLWP